jgi:hypothetical protein
MITTWLTLCCSSLPHPRTFSVRHSLATPEEGPLKVQLKPRGFGLLAKQITIRLPEPTMTNGNNYEETHMHYNYLAVTPHALSFQTDTTSYKIYMTNNKTRL